jgi:hypothetical protein
LQVPEQQFVTKNFVLSRFSLTLVVQFKSSKNMNDMAKIAIKNEKITAFCGIKLYGKMRNIT